MSKCRFLTICIVLLCCVIWSNISLAQPYGPGPNCPPRKKCVESLVLAKKAFSEITDCFECYTGCTDKGCDDIVVRIKRTATLDPKDTQCDETIDHIPSGSKLITDLTYHIRMVGPCTPEGSLHTIPVGTFKGKFKIVGTTGVVVANGRMKGTIGFETHQDDNECCTWPHDEGYMEGTFKAPGATGCKLIASFASNRFGDPPFSQASPCNELEWRNWTLNIDGVVQCRCR